MYAQQRDDEELAPSYAQQGGPAPYDHQGYVAPPSAAVPPPYAPAQGEAFKYEQSSYRDLPFLFAFLLHLLALAIIAGIYGTKMLRAMHRKDNSHDDSYDNLDEKAMVGIVAVSAIVSAVVSAFWLRVMGRFSATIIKMTMVFSIALQIIAGIVSVAVGSIVMGVIYFVMAFFTVVYFYIVRKRIPFAQAVMTASVSSLRENPGPAYFVYVCALFYIAFLSFWGFTITSVYFVSYSSYYNNNPDSREPTNPTAAQRFCMFYALFSLYWTCNVLRNISHVTTAGMCASWWLLPDLPSPTKGAIKRALTTSLGSICLGSLILAVIQTIRALVQMAKQQAREDRNTLVMVLAAIADCLLACIESIFRFVSKYAYTFVAIYGLPFGEAARETGQLLKAKGFDLVVNDDLSGMVLFFSSFVSACCAGIVGGIWASIAGFNGWEWYAVLSFLVGFVIAQLFFSTVESCVATTFVLVASDPARLYQTRPNEYSSIQTSGQIYYGDTVQWGAAPQNSV